MPCSHGVIGPCASCSAEYARMAKRQEFEQKWEAIRRSEIKRLSQLRLKSATAYADMSPREFEDAVATLFRKLGFKVSQTPFVGDGGKDAIAWKENQKYVIECKRYGNRSATGRRDLQILLAAKHDVNADKAIFVSTGRLAAPAVAYAIANDIEYYDVTTFPDLVNRAYGGAKTYAIASTICLECGSECSVRIQKKGPSNSTCRQGHEVHTTIDLEQLKYPNLDVETPWCKDHHIPMRRVDGYKGPFWGCPEYPNCRNTGGSAPPAPQVSEEARKAKRDELLQVYAGMAQNARDYWHQKIQVEMERAGISKMFRSPEEIQAIVAARYLEGR